MTLFPECFYSNRLEILFDRFKERLFVNSHPWTRRLVIVPGSMMRTWLLHRLAGDPAVGVAAGIEIGFIEPNLHKLCTIFCSRYEKEKSKEPTVLELTFALESEMMKVISAYESFSAEERKIWEPMLSYLHVEKGAVFSLRVVKRLHALAMQLGLLFFEYGRMGGAVTSLWNVTPAQNLGWQESLWVRIEKLFSPWNYPFREFSQFFVDRASILGDLQVHVFGLSYLSSLHHQFLTKLGSYAPINYYSLSPCQKFWSDTVSHKEAKKISVFWQKQGVSASQQEELQNYLYDKNALLANFGKLGREMALQVENSEFLISEAYIVSSAVLKKEMYKNLLDDELTFDQEDHELTLLNAVQADLALLRNPTEERPFNFESYDRTIQVHEAPKPLREVQVIYDRLLAIIDQHKDDKEPVLPADIVVMAPDISKYSPYIKSVFGTDESLLNCQIMDLKVPSQNVLVQGFLHLLRLPLSRWDVESLLKLFECVPFQNKHQITKEDVNILKKWFKHAGICWGRDETHRNELLRRDHCFKEMVENSWAGTWEHGLGRLLEGLAMLPDEGNMGAFSPLEHIQFTQSDLLGVLLHLINSLAEDLKPLSDRTKMNLENWSEYLKCLLNAYFVKGTTSEETEGYNLLMQQFEAFASAKAKIEKTEFEFHSIFTYLEDALQQQQTILRESFLHAVRFCSLQPMRAIPAKVIVLLGMQEGEFPRKTDELSLNIIQGHSKAEYFPSKIEFDRYLFLESLLSARKYFLMSYVAYAPEDGGQTLPSLLLCELLEYLNKSYTIQNKDPESYCRFQHPLFPFDKRYFTEKENLFSYSTMYYKAACAYYSSEKEKPHCFLKDFSDVVKEPVYSEDVSLTIKDLHAFAKNPIKSYFNKSLGIYLEKESDKISKKEEDLQLSHLDAAILSRKGLVGSVETLLSKAELAGQLPRGPFKEVGKNKVVEKTESLVKHLGAHGIHPEEVFSIECSDKYVFPHTEGKSWLLPSLSIEVPGVGLVKITGTLETVSLQGFIYFAKDTFESAIKAWPSLLVFCCLIERYSLPIPKKILFIESAKPARLVDFGEPESLLKNYLGYYFKGVQSPSPLLPDWISPILMGSEEKLQELYDLDPENPFKPTYDDYLKWLKKNSAGADVSSAIQSWNPTAQTLFVDLRGAWYSKASESYKEEG